jgi:hypothetical protein
MLCEPVERAPVMVAHLIELGHRRLRRAERGTLGGGLFGRRPLLGDRLFGRRPLLGSGLCGRRPRIGGVLRAHGPALGAAAPAAAASHTLGFGGAPLARFHTFFTRPRLPHLS